MKHIRTFKTTSAAKGAQLVSPNLCLIENKLFIKDATVAHASTLEESINGGLKAMNFRAELTCSEDTTLPVWFTEEEYNNGAPSETLNLTKGDNTVEYPHSIFRMGIVTYDPSTKRRNGCNDKITGIKLYGVWKDGFRMFDNGGAALHSLSSIDLTNLDTSEMTTLASAFQNCASITTIGDISKWDVSNVTNMGGLFNYCPSLKSIGDLSGWKTSKVTNMYMMFNNCNSLSSIGKLDNWDVSNVTNMELMFNGATRNISSFGNLSKWNVSKVTTMAEMFQDDAQNEHLGSLSNQFVKTLAKWDVSNVTDMTCMFYGQGAVTVYPFENWNVGKCTSFNHMFCDNANLQKIDMTNWDTSNLLTCYNMFNDCTSLSNIGDISHWNVEKLIDAGSFLTKCTSLTGKLDLSGWKTSALKNSKRMFIYCSGLTEIDLNSMITSNIDSTKWDGFGEGIHYADDSDDVTMKSMFQECTNLTSILVGNGWQTSQTDATNMFTNCGTDHVTVVE